jgi:heme-degrading monooxygenase HmoA
METNLPYYAVIFTSIRTDIDEGYGDMAEDMLRLAKEQNGFLGVESARSGIGLTISYWESLEAIAVWKNNAAHLLAQRFGKEKWYAYYRVRVCKVEREYDFTK